MSYKNWTYTPSEDNDGDCIKIWHDFTHTDGRTVSCDFNPYSRMTAEDIRLWFDLGMPDRIDSGPLDSFDLNVLWKESHS
jgi:hypothetical protein